MLYLMFVKNLSLLGEEPKTVLLLDTCSAHPDPENVMSDDGKIYVCSCQLMLRH